MLSFEVVGVRPPTEGANDGVDLNNALMLLLSGSGDLPSFDLFFAFHDPALVSTMIGAILKKLGHSTLRYGSDDEQKLVWPIRSIKKLDANNPPHGWKKKAVLAVFATANATKCEIRVLAPNPTTDVTPDICVAFCQPPTDDHVSFCKIRGCIPLN